MKLTELKHKILGISNRALASVGGVLAGIAGTTLPLLADDGGDLFGKLEKTLGEVYSKIFALSTIIAVLCMLIALIFWMTARDERKIQQAKSWFFRVLICYIAINCLGLIIKFAGNLSGSNAYNP